jgi:hypothetical protein
VVFLVVALLTAQALWAQGSEQGKNAQVRADSQDLNIRAYADLLRTDLKTKKVQIITEVMQFDSQQAATFWPLHREYDAELTKLGDEKVSIIQEYAQNYLTMTDEKADHLAQRVMALDDRRMELRKKFYPRFKEAMGAVTAVRFFQVENQIQLIVDLQIAANMPIVEGTGSQ